ncbi:MAG TPA: pyridoxal-phosphate dependent enzyme [Roseiflexaceae bacterium]|nr:pyridoxal-phosphate dependent enzyme [Roseiflexaceae bacterium]
MSLDRLHAFPRLPLGHYPTPLEHLSRLSVALRRPVYLKRDDLPGPALGGNKARKLEYLMAAAQRSGAQRVVSFGGLQSNHVRMTAAAARVCGMEPHLFLFGRRPRRLEGNLLLNGLLGARMYFVPLPQGGEPSLTLERSIRLVRLLAALRVGRHAFIPVGGHSWLGALGYVRAAAELDAQARALGLGDAWVITAAGTGGTLAGLLAGLALCGSALRPLGIDVGKLWRGFPASIARLASEVCARLGQPRAFDPATLPLVERTFVGPRYGAPSPEGTAAIRRLALLEGVVLDPIYTGKAFAGLLDLAERGALGRETPIIFLHTGGAPGLFAEL